MHGALAQARSASLLQRSSARATCHSCATLGSSAKPAAPVLPKASHQRQYTHRHAARLSAAGAATSSVNGAVGCRLQLAAHRAAQPTHRRPLVSYAAASQGLMPRESLPARLLQLLPAPLQHYWPIVQRCAVTVAMLGIIRMGHYIAIPGVDVQRVPGAFMGTTEGERMLRALYGQAHELPASLFHLGISPFINASIAIATVLMLPADMAPFGWARRLRDARKEGKGGEAHLTEVTNYLAFAIALYLSCLRAFELVPYALYTKWFVPQTMAALIAGSCVIHHCANVITASGIGNGTTLVICMGIITEYSASLHKVLGGLETAALNAWQLGLIGAGYLGLLLVTVFLSATEVRLPIVHYSTAPMRPSKDGSARQDLYMMARRLMDQKAVDAGKQHTYFPILLNSTGIMPIIFAGALYYGALPIAAELLGWSALSSTLAAVQHSVFGLMFYGLLVFAMAFVPFGGLNPSEVSEYFNMISVGIKGIAPGPDTIKHLKTKITQSKFWGGLVLALLAVSAHLFDNVCLKLVGTSLATTSLIIIVGAVLQTARQVESLREGPALQNKLDQERSLIQSLNYTS